MEQDNELLLFDRVNVIKDTINKYGENNFYLSFSGGKDSTILHYLIDMALPKEVVVWKKTKLIPNKPKALLIK